jgi:NADPH:quinone reductase
VRLERPRIDQAVMHVHEAKAETCMAVTPKTRSRSLEGENSRAPDTMHAAAIDLFGGPEVLALHTLPVPELDKGEVLIEIHTAGVGGWDAEMRDGGWRPGENPRFPMALERW